MPKMSEPGKQIKVWLPMPIHNQLENEAEQTGRKKAEIAREQIAARYIHAMITTPPTPQEQ